MLIMGVDTGLRGTGMKLAGSASAIGSFGAGVYLMNHWLGAATGVITATNTYNAGCPCASVHI